MSNVLHAVVESHPFMAGMAPHHVETLATLAREMCFDTGRVIFPEGHHGREFYLLVHGMVGLEVTTHGRALRVQTLYAGDEFGFSAVLKGSAKVLQARTLERTDVLVFDGAELLEVFDTDPSFGLAFTLRLLGVVSERLSATRVQLLDLYAPESKRAGT